jgi:hypothetical protein
MITTDEEAMDALHAAARWFAGFSAGTTDAEEKKTTAHLGKLMDDMADAVACGDFAFINRKLDMLFSP